MPFYDDDDSHSYNPYIHYSHQDIAFLRDLSRPEIALPRTAWPLHVQTNTSTNTSRSVTFPQRSHPLTFDLPQYLAQEYIALLSTCRQVADAHSYNLQNAYVNEDIDDAFDNSVEDHNNERSAWPFEAYREQLRAEVTSGASQTSPTGRFNNSTVDDPDVEEEFGFWEDQRINRERAARRTAAFRCSFNTSADFSRVDPEGLGYNRYGRLVPAYSIDQPAAQQFTNPSWRHTDQPGPTPCGPESHARPSYVASPAPPPPEASRGSTRSRDALRGRMGSARQNPSASMAPPTSSSRPAKRGPQVVEDDGSVSRKRKRTTTRQESLEAIDLASNDDPESALRELERQDLVKNQRKPDEDAPKPFHEMTCIICMDNFTNITATPCGHIFCHECLTQALMAGERGERGAGSCPVCRKSLKRATKGHVIPLSFMTKKTYNKKHPGFL